MATRLTRALTTAMVLSAALSDPAHPQDLRVELRGRVLDASSLEPVSGAQVRAPLADIGVVTDSLGGFSVPFVRDTRYDLVAGAMGYQAVSMTLGPEAEEGFTTIHLVPDPEASAGLEVLRERLELRRRQRRRSRTLRLIEEDELATSTEESAYELVRRLAFAQPCQDQRDLCRLGGSRVRLCVDDASPGAGARELDAYEPADLWLIEVYDNGRSVRVYSRWFIDDVVRTRQGEIRLNPIC